MYALLRQITTPRVAITQLLSLVPAWLIAEFFYKFHSFTLECAAFLATWAVLDAVVHAASARTARSIAAATRAGA